MPSTPSAPPDPQVVAALAQYLRHAASLGQRTVRLSANARRTLAQLSGAAEAPSRSSGASRAGARGSAPLRSTPAAEPARTVREDHRGDEEERAYSLRPPAVSPLAGKFPAAAEAPISTPAAALASTSAAVSAPATAMAPDVAAPASTPLPVVAATPVAPIPNSLVNTSLPVDAGPPPADYPTITLGSGPRAEKLSKLRELVTPCTKCAHLAAFRTQTVFGVGNIDAHLMFVGEAPGAEEDKKGEPFVGPAGQLLTKMIGAMRLSRERVYIANVLKCRPDMPPGSSGNRKPTGEEMATCLPYLRAQINIIQPRVIVALGLTAVEGLLGKPAGSMKMGAMRGHFTEFNGVPVMPTFHPSYLLRNQAITEKRKTWEDLMQVMDKLEMEITDKERGYFLSKP